ncbi:MAG: hypothetical protein AAF975_04770 [Spirochaetota bacterium]
MNKGKFNLMAAAALGIVLLFSCALDEEQNLLFRLKDTVKVAGVWVKSGSTNRFTFASDGSFTAKVDGYSSSGTFHYRELQTSIYDSRYKRIYAYFDLNWAAPLLGPSGTSSLRSNLQVMRNPNGDLYFDWPDGSANEYVQTQ